MSARPRSTISDGETLELRETFGERLAGLKEMLPDWATSWTESVAQRSAKGVKTVYRGVCLVTWVCFSASIMLLAPVVFETELDLLERRRLDQERNRIRDDLLSNME